MKKKCTLVAISQTYRKDEVENEEDIFAEEATSAQSHDEQMLVLACALLCLEGK